jgi:hypothetical protein
MAKRKSKKSTKAKKSVPKKKPARAVKIKPHKKKARATRASKPARAARSRSLWLDDAAQTPVIDRYARQLGTFIDAMADGRIDEAELKAQESRLVQLMKEVEPRLSGDLHEKVTRLLCELTAFDVMQMLHIMAQGRVAQENQASTFQG